MSLTPCKPSVIIPITPLTVRGLRHFVKTSSSDGKIALLECAVFQLATQYEIQAHENKGLRLAITQEKKRRQRGKRLNLLSEEEMGGAQFWSPQRILQAKTFQASKEAAEEEEKRQKTIRKEQAACQRRQKQAEQQERTIQRQLRQQATKEEKERQKAERQAIREQKRL